jgi:DNA-binding NarL/FixJ family response regulator
MVSRSTTVLIVDDNELIRSALRLFFEVSTDMRVCGEAADGAEAIEKAKELKPGLILMDLAMPRMNGMAAAWTIKNAMPEARIVAFTLYSDAVGNAVAKLAGVDLIVSKTEGATGLMKALQPFLGGNAPLPQIAI